VVSAAQPFDLVLLGMGEDGHTASLFPGQQHAAGDTVHAVHDAPKPPPERVSLGVAALNAAAEVLVLVSGAGKHDAVQRWKQGEDLPVTRIHGQAGVDVYIDSAAETGDAA
jgi:6-phosphogluconolactonase